MSCLVCGATMLKLDDHSLCEQCQKLEWKDKVLLLRLLRIANSLTDIEKKLPDRNKW